MIAKKYYVTMTDKFLSGWGPAKGKISKLVLECDSFEEAERVEAYAKQRGDMKHVNICVRCPSYDSQRYYVSYKTRENW